MNPHINIVVNDNTTSNTSIQYLTSADKVQESNTSECPSKANDNDSRDTADNEKQGDPKNDKDTNKIVPIIRPLDQSLLNSFDCRHCSYRSHTRQKIDIHMKDEHKNIKPVTCNLTYPQQKKESRHFLKKIQSVYVDKTD